MTRQIYAGPVAIGGGAPVSIQSMLNTRTTDVEGGRSGRSGSWPPQAVRSRGSPSRTWTRRTHSARSARSLPCRSSRTSTLTTASPSPQPRQVLPKFASTPGNIGGAERVRAVVDVCKEKHIPIRIGVNGGSLDKKLLEKYGHPTPEALVESAFSHLELLEANGFYDTCVSMKSSNVPLMMAAYRLFASKSDYPLHVGVTETGTKRMGTIKSAMGIGGLLCLGIGDTIRVSLTADPVEEVYAARDILKAAGLRKDGVNIVACPTCGRTRIDLIGLASRVEEALKDCKKPLTVAVMGCIVNGPGEAREADVGIAGGEDCGVLFVHGEMREKLPYDQLLPALLRYVDAL